MIICTYRNTNLLVYYKYQVQQGSQNIELLSPVSGHLFIYGTPIQGNGNNPFPDRYIWVPSQNLHYGKYPHPR